ncbi:MAG: Nramp family divalent metal transporter [Bdellovibrionaceae bacterium]|nr:Nramp family divalent metal transporter [Bdellovibrio sp.]
MSFKFSLPKIATAPFCPSEVQGSIAVPPGSSFWRKVTIFFGPALLVCVGYMEPGNWATDIEAGSKYGYNLLFVVLLSSLAAIFLQCLALRVGLISGKDIAELCRAKYSRRYSFILWILAEVAIIATDIAEVLGCALAFKLLFGCSLHTGILITALDTLIVLGLKGKGFRQVEAIILGLVMTIGVCYFIELWLVKPFWPDVFVGFIPSLEKISAIEPLYIAIGILGATVMPHNLYLHSSIVKTRKISDAESDQRSAIRMNTLDTVVSLFLAFLVNSAILILAAAAFHNAGRTDVISIDQAFHLLDPIVGTSLAAILFGVALLAAGQSSTFTGTIAGQIILEGFLDLKIPCWKRRVITRALALVPAYIGVSLLGENSIGRLLVMTQVVLSLQLPFVILPLIQFASDSKLMKSFAIKGLAKIIAWMLLMAIVVANIWLIMRLLQITW